MPQHQATYRLPIRYINLNAAEMRFWDAIYYLFETQGWSASDGRRIDINNDTLADLTGLSKRQLRTERDKALSTTEKAYQLFEEDSEASWHFILFLPNYETLLKNHVIEKPLAFIKQGWIRHLDYPVVGKKRTHRFPTAILNRLWAKPGGKSIHLSELVHRCALQNKKKPDPADIAEAITFLAQLKLIDILPDDTYRLRPQAFNRPAEALWNALPCPWTPSPWQADDLPAIQEARQFEPERTAQALTLAELGNFDLVSHFEEILRDLHYIPHPHGWPLLQDKVHLHRGKPPGPKRWENCWAQFQRELRSQSRTIKSKKRKLDLSKITHQEADISLKGVQPANIMWAKIILWLNTPDYGSYTFNEVIHVSLYLEDKLIWKTDITYEREMIRRDLTAQFKQATATTCNLTLVVEAPLRRVQITTQLEASVWLRS